MSLRFTISLGLALACPLFAVAQTTTTVRIEVEPTASERLVAMGLWLDVRAFLYGEPANETILPDEMGRVYLGWEDAIVFPVSQTITLGGTTAGAPLDLVKEPFININISSIDFADGLNVLDCGYLDDSIAVLTAADNVISCKWMGE